MPFTCKEFPRMFLATSHHQGQITVAHTILYSSRMHPPPPPDHCINDTANSAK
ncbi:hypothetical protein X975_16570, partial [Stegodyphus mimosarum]